MVSPILQGLVIGILGGLQILDLQQKRKQGESIRGVVINLILVTIVFVLAVFQHT